MGPKWSIRSPATVCSPENSEAKQLPGSIDAPSMDPAVGLALWCVERILPRRPLRAPIPRLVAGNGDYSGRKAATTRAGC